MSNEQDIIDDLKNGDKETFELVFNTYYAPLCEFAAMYVTDDDAEEIVQDFMFYIWESREYLTLEGTLRAYFFKAIKNKCLNSIRKKKSDTFIHSHIYEKLKDQFESPDSFFIDEMSQNIQNAINELPNNYRETFELSRFSELTNAQVADKLGVSIKTVEYRITQSLKILRISLKEYLYVLL